MKISPVPSVINNTSANNPIRNINVKNNTKNYKNLSLIDEENESSKTEALTSNQIRFSRQDYVVGKEELNFFFQFKNKDVYKDYLLYNLNTKPFAFDIFFISILTFILLPIKILFFAYWKKEHTITLVALNVVMVFALLVISGLGWIYVLERLFPKNKIFKRMWLQIRGYLGLVCSKSLNQFEDDDDDDPTATQLSYSRKNLYKANSDKIQFGSMKLKFSTLQHILVFSIMTFIILFFATNSIEGNCTDYGSKFLNLLFQNCRSMDDLSSSVYPYIFMLTPIIVYAVFRECLFELHCFQFLLVMVICFFFVIRYTWSIPRILVLVGWSVGGFCLLLDLHVHNVAAFLSNYQLREILLEKERNADRVAAVEMRHMIGNVAHDLKTPLASFTTGLEVISEIIANNEQTLHSLRLQSHSNSHSKIVLDSNSSAVSEQIVSQLHENNVSVQSFLHNIRDTNTFMLMTINRCIDYTKASRGFKLVPKFETVDLLETLRLPLDCMKNIQERIQIELKPIEKLNESICSHIITDKQWLQENILCLLSNAVKYSTGGVVTIGVDLILVEKAPQPRDELPVKLKPKPQEKKPQRDSISDIFRRQLSTVTFFSGKTLSSKGKKASGSSSDKDVENPDGSNNDNQKQVLVPGQEELCNQAHRGSVMSVTSITSEPDRAGQLDHRGSLLSMSGSFFDNPAVRRAFSVFNRSRSVPKLADINEGVDVSNTPRPHAESILSTTSIISTTTTPNGLFTQHIKFEIEDNGIGMSPEAMSQLFSPFKQAQRLAGGTGLGLYSLAKRIEALHGSYGVSKRLDGKQGSLFWFSIPYRPDFVTAELYAHSHGEGEHSIHKTEDSLVGNYRSLEVENNPHNHINKSDSKDSQPLSPSLKSPIPSPNGPLKRRISAEFNLDTKLPPLNILVVDDSASIVKMSSMMLRRQGHHISSADNGEIALKKIQEYWETNQRGFDIILMDLQMPVMDGLEATRRLRRLEKTRINWIKSTESSKLYSASDELTAKTNQESSISFHQIESPENTHNPLPSTLTQQQSSTSMIYNSFSNWNMNFADQPFHHAVIGVSANSDDETARQAIEAGVDAFIGKPFSMDVFSSTVIKVFHKIHDFYLKNLEKQIQLEQEQNLLLMKNNIPLKLLDDNNPGFNNISSNDLIKSPKVTSPFLPATFSPFSSSKILGGPRYNKEKNDTF